MHKHTHTSHMHTHTHTQSHIYICTYTHLRTHTHTSWRGPHQMQLWILRFYLCLMNPRHRWQHETRHNTGKTTGDLSVGFILCLFLGVCVSFVLNQFMLIVILYSTVIASCNTDSELWPWLFFFYWSMNIIINYWKYN